MSFEKTLFRRGIRLASILLLGGATAASAQDWQASPGSTVCFDLTVTEAPTVPDLGILVEIPAGGLLPGKFPAPDVRDANGKAIESVIVGYDPDDAMMLLFAEQPVNSKVSVFFKPADRPVPNPKDSKLVPSVILATKVGNASLSNARRLAAWPQTPGMRLGRFSYIGCCVNPYGPDRDYSTWFCGALNFTKKRHIYLTTVSSDGSEFWVDGKAAVTWDGNHNRAGGVKGQHGKWFDFAPGLHRIDYFQYAGRNCQKPEAQICWKGEGVTLQNTNDVPEFITGGYALSGKASIDSIRYKNGRTGAAISGNNDMVGYVWCGAQPLFLFTFRCTGADPKAKLSWSLGKSSVIADKKEVEWLFAGDTENLFSSSVSLTAANEAGSVTATKRVWVPWMPVDPFSLDNPEQSLGLRKAILNMLKGVATGDPCADWSPDHWELVTELLEPYRGGPILFEIFNRAFGKSYRKGTTAQQRAVMEDCFIDTLRLTRDDKRLLDWIDAFEKGSLGSYGQKGGNSSFHWKEVRFLTQLYDIADTNAAKKALVFLKEAASLPEQQQIAALREGDYNQAIGDLTAAAHSYQQAQDLFRSRNATGMAGGRTRFGDSDKRVAEAFAGTNDTAKAKAKQSRAALKSLGATSTSKVDSWKVYTLNSASMYATIQSFLSQSAYADALKKLSEWENTSPLAKLQGEYPLAAAHTYLAVGDYRRAANILEIYRRNATMDALLADAYKTEIECWDKLKKPAKIKELAKEFVKRFPGHPYETEMKQWLE